FSGLHPLIKSSTVMPKTNNNNQQNFWTTRDIFRNELRNELASSLSHTEKPRLSVDL
ncbi:hypothetical protein PRIPAC_85213, partial [Pristionchus pacificus]